MKIITCYVISYKLKYVEYIQLVYSKYIVITMYHGPVSEHTGRGQEGSPGNGSRGSNLGYTLDLKYNNMPLN